MARKSGLHYEVMYCSLTGAIGIDPIKGTVAFCSQTSNLLVHPDDIMEVSLIEKAAPVRRARSDSVPTVDYFLIIRVSGHPESELCLHSFGKKGVLRSIGQKLVFLSKTTGSPVILRAFKIASNGQAHVG